MAEQKRRNQNDSERSNGSDADTERKRRTHSRSRSSDASKLSARDAIQQVREELPQLMGKPVEAILGVHHDDDHWEVTAQIVEPARIPDSRTCWGCTG